MFDFLIKINFSLYWSIPTTSKYVKDEFLTNKSAGKRPIMRIASWYPKVITVDSGTFY